MGETYYILDADTCKTRDSTERLEIWLEIEMTNEQLKDFWLETEMTNEYTMTVLFVAMLGHLELVDSLLFLKVESKLLSSEDKVDLGARTGGPLL